MYNAAESLFLLTLKIKNMIHTIKFVLSVLIVSFAFTSCEKEYSVENGGIGNNGGGGTSSGTSVYTWEGAPGTCATPVISGVYQAGTTLNGSNTVVLTVNVTTVGTYTVSTGTNNGISFSGTGTFTITGSQILILTGSGTPAAAGTFTFTPGTNGCSFSITTNPAGAPAVFTLNGAPGACTAPTISGSYSAGTALGGSNTVQLSVNVTTAGIYNIVSPTVNGFSYNGSGTLATGNQTITLNGTGTPNTTGPAVFTPVTGGCSFTINVTTAGGTSVYTLTGAPSACTNPVIAGFYTAGVPLGAGNTITIKADVTTAGTYNISTTTANGITFSGSGTLAVGAAQTIILTGTGTPTSAITSNFTVGINGCNFPITTVAPPPAVYTLTGAPGACNPIIVNGSYFTGNVLTATNTAIVEVNVTTTGSYTITSNTVNGMTFSKTGLFATTGTQSVTLAGSGTPAAVGTNTFTAGTSGCTFTVIVTVPTSPCTGLVDGKFVMTGQFTLNGFSFGVAIGSQFQVTIQQSPVQLDVFFPGTSAPTPGTYSIGTVTMHCLAANFTNWNATSGSVYVSTDINGNTVVEFCNVNFSGAVIPSGTITSTGAGKMVF